MKLELAQKIQKELLQRVIGKNIAQHGAAHIITEIRLEDLGNNDYATRLIAVDDSSGVPVVEGSLYQWLLDNDDEGFILYGSIRG